MATNRNMADVRIDAPPSRHCLLLTTLQQPYHHQRKHNQHGFGMKHLISGVIFLAMATTSSTAFATEWQRLGTGEIGSTLNEQSLIYEGASQVFYVDGRTLYESSGPSWGEWREISGKYCSLWPPGAEWSCYDLDISSDKTVVRFVDSFGNETKGTFTNP